MINLSRYCDQYIEYGKRLDYFNIKQGEEFRNKIMSYKVYAVPGLEGNAVVDSLHRTIKYNPDRLRDEKSLSGVLFHEFTHICSNIHKHLNRGYWPKLKENFTRFTDTDSYKGIPIENKDNPYNYIQFGGLFMDETIAESVATEMMKEKYNIPSPQKNRIFNCGDDNIIRYRSTFDYYGIGEPLLYSFAKTLFIDRKRNLHSLARESFKEEFMYDLIRQHNETKTTRDHFIKEIALMGVIGHTWEKNEGRYPEQQRISGDVVYNSIFELKDLLDRNPEDRAYIPDSIQFPEIY